MSCMTHVFSNRNHEHLVLQHCTLNTVYRPVKKTKDKHMIRGTLLLTPPKSTLMNTWMHTQAHKSLQPLETAQSFCYQAAAPPPLSSHTAVSYSMCLVQSECL